MQAEPLTRSFEALKLQHFWRSRTFNSTPDGMGLGSRDNLSSFSLLRTQNLDVAAFCTLTYTWDSKLQNVSHQCSAPVELHHHQFIM
jgi:hypothetical protein